MTIGQRIYELRTARNLSQGDLANQLDVSRQSVSKWETDSAIPDLDKLIKMCDIFQVTLDELVGRKNESSQQAETLPPQSTQSTTQPGSTSAFTTPKIVGYILLTVSLLGWILFSIFADPIVAFLLALPMLSCAIICLTVKHRVGYWCMWVVWFVFEILLKHFIMGFTRTSILVFRAILYVILFLITLRVFKDVPLARKRKGILLIAWMIYLSLILTISLLQMMIEVPPREMIAFNVIPSAIPMLATPFLFIYTARYLSSRKHDRK